jgi:hypothetical protein
MSYSSPEIACPYYTFMGVRVRARYINHGPSINNVINFSSMIFIKGEWVPLETKFLNSGDWYKTLILPYINTSDVITHDDITSIQTRFFVDLPEVRITSADILLNSIC